MFEMATFPGGRARDVGEEGLDNGQHICIGAYSETLRVLRRIGVTEETAFLRLPLRLVDAQGAGLRLRSGPPMPAFALAVLRRQDWRWGERLALLGAAFSWWRSEFSCAPQATVAMISASLPACVRHGLIEPLCIAALNTPAESASGAVFLRVLRDALASGRGASDLLLPRIGLGSLLPRPALEWLQRAGTVVRMGHRAERLERAGGGWRIGDEWFDRVIVAASAVEAGRLIAPHDAAWSACATALRYEPIVTVYARGEGVRLAEPMLLLESDSDRPAQFVFDRGQLGGPAGLLAFVVSGAAGWMEKGAQATEQAVLAQAAAALGPTWSNALVPVRTIVEKRATFRCTPGLDRPAMRVAEGLLAAGDHVAGPYPATLEGAVRSGVAAARAAVG